MKLKNGKSPRDTARELVCNALNDLHSDPGDELDVKLTDRQEEKLKQQIAKIHNRVSKKWEGIEPLPE